MNRTAPQQTQVYEICVWMEIEILNNFICQGVLCIHGMYWDTCLQRKLQQITIQQSEVISQSDC